MIMNQQLQHYIENKNEPPMTGSTTFSRADDNLVQDMGLKKGMSGLRPQFLSQQFNNNESSPLNSVQDGSKSGSGQFMGFASSAMGDKDEIPVVGNFGGVINLENQSP